MYTHVQVYGHAVYTCVCVCICTCMCVYVYIYMSVCVCTSVHTVAILLGIRTSCPVCGISLIFKKKLIHKAKLSSLENTKVLRFEISYHHIFQTLKVYVMFPKLPAKTLYGEEMITYFQIKFLYFLAVLPPLEIIYIFNGIPAFCKRIILGCFFFKWQYQNGSLKNLWHSFQNICFCIAVFNGKIYVLKSIC